MMLRKTYKCNQERKVIDISDFMPHKVSEVICIKCGKRWIAIRPENTLLEDMECPNHHIGFVIETGEELDEG
ncbi:MAG: hypothetical protein LBK43_03135 [Treponema sp.]|jgi:hypothetical protein|nr:hypothetical protein [Treponema sp.]